ncbi:unnamed protein product [Ostreobium quekettii]|uniref:Uncharacterized protein n=1 Tax=Ostreobium quekettii TaxID=121088 RepID=A0A8S1IR89_9CHLO|nr:unnamed protein product [Ostreobium quekettii]|eukprot:evm.model.scf_519EXC.10 EVM.evm.TU.scf_519EXC.10   scf_519EXC:58873-60709(-)
MTNALKEKGIWGAVASVSESLKKYQGYAMDAFKAGAEQAGKMSQVSVAMEYAKELWSKITGSAAATSFIAKGKEMVMPILEAYVDYLKKLPNMAYDTAASTGEVAKAPLKTATEKANALVDYVVGSPYYAKALKTASGYITWAQNSVVGQKVVSVVSPYAMPYIEKIESNEFVHGIVERLKATKSD